MPPRHHLTLFLDVGRDPRRSDPCLFSNDKVICLVYVDDCLFFGKEPKDIDAIIRDLQEPEDESKETMDQEMKDDVDQEDVPSKRA